MHLIQWLRTASDLRTLLRFCVVGGTASIIYLSISFALVGGLAFGATLAASIAFAIVVSFNYALHYCWTFESTEPHRSAFSRFLIVTSGGFLLNLAVVEFGAVRLGFPLLPVQLATIAIIVVWNFLMSAFWVFRSRGRERRVRAAAR